MKTEGDPNGIWFCRAEPGDENLLSAISVAAKSYWPYPSEWLDLWKDDLTITRSDIEAMDITKMMAGDECIGFGAVSSGGGTIELEHLWVVPNWIGKGLGRRLFEQSMVKACPEGSRVRVIADPYAEGFYRRMGFEETGEVVASKPEGRVLKVMVVEWGLE